MLFVLISIIFTFPLIFHMKSFLFGEKGDTYSAVWTMWYHNTYSRFNYSSDININILASPFGYNRISYHPFGDLMIFLFGDIFGEIAGYNLLILAGFILSSFTMYKLTFFLSKNQIASIFSGILFGFSPYAIVHAIAGHITFNFLLPLYVLSLFYMQKKRTLISAILCGIIFALVSLSYLYYGYFMFFFTLCFIFYDFLIIKKQNLSIKKLLINWGITGIISIGILALHVINTKLGFAKEKSIISRPLKDLFTYSAKPWDYLLPSVYNPFLGKLSKPITDSLLIGSNYTEQTLYLGIIPLILALYSVWLYWKNKIDASQKSYIRFLFFTGLLMLIFSAPPFVPLGEFKIAEGGEIITKYKLYFPSYFLYKIAPMFRVYARFGVLVILCVSALAGIGFAHLSNKLKYRRNVFIILCFLIVAFEFISIPKFINVNYIPPVYEWLKNQNTECIVVEYPIEQNIHGLPGEYQFYQRIHKKRLFNGTISGTEADKIKLSIVEPTDKKVPFILKNIGVKYLLLHKDKYMMHRGKRPFLKDLPGFKLVKIFPATEVYEIR